MALRKTAVGAGTKRKPAKRNIRGDKKKIETAKQTTGMADQSQSLLMSLPAELRNRVYEDVFKAKAFGNLAFWSKKGHRYKPPGILMACKQSYEEGKNASRLESTRTQSLTSTAGVGLFYATTSMHFPTVHRARDFLLHVPSARLSLIQDVRINMKPTPSLIVLQRGALHNALRFLKKELLEKGNIELEEDVVKVPGLAEEKGIWTSYP